MVSENLCKYPDFLQGFKELEEMKNWQWMAVSTYIHEAERMLEQLKLETTWDTGEYWSQITNFPVGINYTNASRLLHHREAVTTLDVLSNYMNCWLLRKRYSLEYDFESMTITLKVQKNLYNDDCYNRIRNIIPCNMLLVVELTESWLTN